MCFVSNVRTSLVLFWQVCKRVYPNNATTLVSRSVIEYSILDIQNQQKAKSTNLTYTFGKECRGMEILIDKTK